MLLKRMNNSTIVAIILMLSTGAMQELSGQVVPGYLGKKMTLSYRGGLFPAVLHPTSPTLVERDDSYDSDYLNKDGIGLSFWHHLDFERVSGSHFSLVGSADFYRTHYGTTLTFNADPTESYTSRPDYEPIEAFPSMLSIGGSVGFRWYSEHYAPLGDYFQLSLGFDNISYDGFDAPVGQTEVISVADGSIQSLRLAMSWGTQRIINDQIVIGYGFDLSYGVYSGGEAGGFSFPKLWDNFGINEQPNPGAQARAEEAVAQRAAGKALMNISFSIGLLP